MLGPMLRGVSASSPPPTYTYNGRSSSTSNATTYSITSVPIGTAASDRLVVAVVTATGSAGRTVSSATIGGVTATQYLLANEGAINGVILVALVPTGTTATVAVTWSGSMTNMVVHSYSLYGLTSVIPGDTAYHRLAVAGSEVSLDLDLVPDSIVIAGSRTGTTVSAHAWSGTSGIAENDEVTVESRISSAASIQYTGSTGSKTVVVTTTGEDNFWAFAASWR